MSYFLGYIFLNLLSVLFFSVVIDGRSFSEIEDSIVGIYQESKGMFFTVAFLLTFFGFFFVLFYLITSMLDDGGV